MNIALICPSNMLYMPYVGNYEKVLKENNANYDIINWDRFHIEDIDNNLKYRDKKIAHQRNFFDYYRFKKFIIKRLNEKKYDKIIVFGIQLTFFLKDMLQKKYNGDYVVDIRDHNRIINYFKIKEIVDNSAFTVLSSPGFKEWLPDSGNYIINHNTQINSLDKFEKISNTILDDKKINIAYIGAIRDYQVNIDFINALKNSEKTELRFHGEGDINKDIKEYVKLNEIKNVFITGRYEKEEEKSLYKQNDLINVLRYNDGINNKTALPNRLYNSLIYGKPMIVLKGTYLSEVIDNYDLGLVMDSFELTEENIENFFMKFNKTEFHENRKKFFLKVIEDNERFKKVLIDYLIN